MVMGSTQHLTEMSSSNIFWVGKGGRCVELTNLSPSCAYIHEIWKPRHPGTLYRPVQACIGIGSPISWNKQNIVNLVCCHAVPNQRKEHFLCSKVPRHRSFVLLIGVLWWIWVWSIGGKILEGEQKFSEKNVSQCRCAPHDAHTQRTGTPDGGVLQTYRQTDRQTDTNCGWKCSGYWRR